MTITTKSKHEIVAKKGKKTHRFTWRLEEGKAILKISTRHKDAPFNHTVDEKEYAYNSTGELYTVLLGVLDLKPSELSIEVKDGEKVYSYSKLCLALGQPITNKEKVR